MAIEIVNRKVTVYLNLPSPLVEFTDESNQAVHVALGPTAIAGTCVAQDERGLEIRPIEWASDAAGEGYEPDVLAGGAFVPWHSVGSILFGTGGGVAAGSPGGGGAPAAGGGPRAGGIAPGLGGRPGFGRR